MKNILKFIVVLSALVIAPNAKADEVVTFKISDGIDDNYIKQKIEKTVSCILTEANAAHASKRELNYASLGIPTSVQGSLAALWDNSPFISLDTEIVEKCLITNSGYQVRNIPLILMPMNPGDVSEGEDYQEAVVSFDKQGNLVSFYLSISMNLYMNVVRESKEVTDLRRRQLILDYVEQFRTAYNQKDLDFLEAVFSDDALIITGKLIKRTTGDGIRLPAKIEYKKQSKREYLSRLAVVFQNNKQIRVTFDEIEVMRHPGHKDFYGVTLHQGYSSDRYHDDGYLFLLWDFRNEDYPQIHVRTWQPDSYDPDGKRNQRIPKDEIFSLSDFDI